ncbi:MAG TPA: hypothetical protein VD886_02020 [Herpetosiphonaceae bacterium]|nr:hypothetical protein [Herpetosiphonaceae bacterium]
MIKTPPGWPPKRMIRRCMHGLILLTLAQCGRATPPGATPSAMPSPSAPAADHAASQTPELPPLPAPRGTPAPTRSTSQPSPVLGQGWKTDWLRGIPCTAPCYAGITPGNTTIAEARSILERNPRVGALVERGGFVEWGWNNLDLIGGGGTQGESTEGGGAIFGPPGGTELSPVMGIAPRLEAVPFAAVIREFGTPSHIIAYASSSITEDLGTPGWVRETRMAYGLGFVYQPQGLTFNADIPADQKPRITTTLRLHSPTFFDPARAFTDIITDVPSVPWQGWQPFDVYCRDLYTFEPCAR